MTRFPKIKNINDPEVQRALQGAGFNVMDKAGVHIISYVVNSPDVFPEGDAMRLEFRGIMFDKETGDILRRPLHKFFNMGERESTRNLDFSKPHVILEKLDGSMIAPFSLPDNPHNIFWATKRADDRTYSQIDHFLVAHPWYKDFVMDFIRNGYTPIFEWCTRKNRIVLDYPEDRLVLLAIRNMYTGEYYSYKDMAEIAKRRNLDCVKFYDPAKMPTDQFLAAVREAEDQEGVIVRFEDGHMVKVKSEWYCTIHRAKEAVEREHDVVKMLLSGTIDDFKALLQEHDLTMLEEYERGFWKAMEATCSEIFKDIFELRLNNVTKKEFNLQHREKYAKWKHGFIYKFLENNEPIELMQPLIEFALPYSNRAIYLEQLKGIVAGIPAFQQVNH